MTFDIDAMTSRGFEASDKSAARYWRRSGRARRKRTRQLGVVERCEKSNAPRYDNYGPLSVIRG